MSKTIQKIKTTHKENKELLDSLDAYIDENFRLVIANNSEQSLKQIRKYFRIELPEDINFMTLVDTARVITEKYQQATYLRDKQKIKLVLLDQAREERYNTAYNDLREETRKETGKALAAESCKVAAILATKQLQESVNTQQVVHNFWDGICKTLVEVRKLCESMIIALSGDAKIQRDFIVKGDK